MAKKIIALLLVMILGASALISCGATTTNTPDDTTASTDTPATEDKANIVTPDIVSGSYGETFWNLFTKTLSEKPDATLEEIANTLITGDHIPFMAGASPVEAGYLGGFTNEITGFKSAYTFGPMVMGVPFVGYVFELESVDNVKDFTKTLEDNADPRWNVCTEADHTLIGAVENTVFFLMCPASVDLDGGEEGGEMGEVIWPDVSEGAGAMLFDAFVGYIENNPAIGIDELATLLITHESIQFMGGAMPVEAGYLAGFTADISGFESAYSFAPMISTIPFVGYLFQIAEDGDVNAFIDTIEPLANPSWNVCTTADQTVIGAVGNTVFFLMCPTSLEG
ncbi:MAG: hypothetical protein IKT70_03935 [Clostridia bacterium]|nr:hypothetical protein [Clostridia bacterium]